MKIRTASGFALLFGLAVLASAVMAPSFAADTTAPIGTLATTTTVEPIAEAGCSPVMIDETGARMLSLLNQAEQLSPIGVPSRQYVGSSKVERRNFEFQLSNGQAVQATISCTGTCTGNGCGVQGCDPIFEGAQSGCSACSCIGDTCTAQCVCKKSVTEVGRDN